MSKKNSAASQVSLVPLGRLVSAHGVRGEIKFLPYASPCSSLHLGISVFLQGKDEEIRSFLVESVRPQPPFSLLRLQGITSREQAQRLRDWTLAVDASLLPPLQEGEFYYYQVVGLPVYTTAEAMVGVLTSVFFSGEHDVWVVRQGKKEYLIPVIDEIIRSIDILGQRIVIEPLEGLLE